MEALWFLIGFTVTTATILVVDESIYTSRKDLKKDYKFIEKHHELSSKLDKLYKLSDKE